MPQVVRVGDANAAGGIALRGIASVIVNGRPISVVGDPVTPHPPCPKPAIHCSATTTTGSSTVIAGGIRVQYVGCVDTCGHARAQGSPNTVVGV